MRRGVFAGRVAPLAAIGAALAASPAAANYITTGYVIAPARDDVPISVAVDPRSAGGHAFVVDAKHFRIDVATVFGTFVGTWGSKGNGPCQFQQPEGIAVDRATGDVIFADGYNARVERCTPTGGYRGQYTSHVTPGGVAVMPKCPRARGSCSSRPPTTTARSRRSTPTGTG